MGKIRTKVIGDETLENEQKKEARLASEAKRAKKRSEQKKAEKAAVPPVGGLRIEEKTPETTEPKVEVKKIKKQTTSTSKRTRSKQYQTIAKMIDRNKTYPVLEALTILEQMKRDKFDETVELHINTTEAGITGTLTLPHGTGKKTRVAIADPTTTSGQADALIKKIESGITDFDILIATPAAMPKLAKVAKILGPRGLMPNPKNGTITNDPERLALGFAKGQVRFKTEAKTPIIHLIIGKLSFGDKKLSENIKEVFRIVPKVKVKNATLKSTMSPGIKIAL